MAGAKCEKCHGLGFTFSGAKHENGRQPNAWAARCECQPSLAPYWQKTVESSNKSSENSMAGADYRHCDKCGGKAFYDADLSYEYPRKVEGKMLTPAEPFKTAGQLTQHDTVALGHLGDWAVLCTDCAKTHKCVVAPI